MKSRFACGFISLISCFVFSWPGFAADAEPLGGDAAVSEAAETAAGSSAYAVLLEGFLANDAEGRRLELARERAALELRRYALETGMSVTVSSGDMVFTFSPEGAGFSAEPGVTVNVPKLRDTALTLGAPIGRRVDGGVQYGVDLQARMGIITGKGAADRAALLEQEDRFRSALRDVAYRRLAAEKEFCEGIKQLISLRDAMLKAQGELLLARYDLESKRAGGYGAASVILRTAELTLRSRERELREAERALETALGKFSEACGAAGADIPRDIPDEALIEIGIFDPGSYIELEKAVRAYGINNLVRQSQDQVFTLDGRAGYSWRGGDGAGGMGGAPKGSALSAGAGISVGGITLSAGVSVPLEKPKEPSVTVAVQWKSAGFAVFAIDRRLRLLAAEAEQAAITDAEKKFRDLAADYGRRKADLEWQQETYGEEAELYRLNAEEQRAWFDRGIIRETDYLAARTNQLLAENRLLSARIDRRLYNLEVQSLFVPAGEHE
jgi:hypothetical protein